MAATDVEDEDGAENILYDLTVFTEWRHESEVFKRIVGKDVSSLSRITSSTQRTGWTVLRSLGLPMQTASPCHLPPSLVKLVNCRINWNIAVTRDGKIVAILQDQCIEIRSQRDDFATVTGRATLPQRDRHPQWRHLAWSPDNTMLACSNSSGVVNVYDIVGTLLFTIDSVGESTQNSKLPTDLSQAVAALIFTDKQPDKEWCTELLVVNHHGKLSSYKVDRDKGYKLQHTFLFNSCYPLGISCMVYHGEAGLLYVGGCGQEDDSASVAAQEGLTVWRILSDYPHYKQVTDYSEDLTSSQRQGSFRKKFMRMPSLAYMKGSQRTDCVYKLSLAPSGKQLVSVHCTGKLGLWSTPGLALRKSWKQEQQPFSDEANPEFAENPQIRKQIKDLVNTKSLTDVNWWSDEAVILARGTGAVTVSSTNSLRNLLGNQPEWFEPAPSVTGVQDGGFLGLEVENRFPTKRLLSSSEEEEEGSEDEAGGVVSRSWGVAKQALHYVTDMDTFKPPKKKPNLEEEGGEDEAGGVVSRSWGVAKQALHYVTDMDTFKPPKKKPKLVNRTYRLVCLKSTTPEELFARKLENEEYGEAKALAQAYGLDTDLVYQKQWRKSAVENASIVDYLSKISKRSWVLHECMERMSEKIDAMKSLLEFGLRGTDLPALIQIGKGEDHGRFLLCDPEEGLYDDIELDKFDPDLEEKKRQLLQDRQAELIKQVDFKNLTLEQQELCRSRKKLLRYLYRLKTYECILGGVSYAAERFQPQVFEKFRAQNIVETAVDYAQSSDWKALETLFTFHGKDLMPHRLAILSNFPETTNPAEYKSLLPEISGGEVQPLESDTWDVEDWVDSEPCRTALEPGAADPGDFLYEGQPELAKYRGDVTCATLSDWYQYRATEIERLSRQADYALDFVKMGIERGLEGLTNIMDDLVTMETLVYSCHVDDSLIFAQLQAMADYDKMELIMSKSSEEMYGKNLRRWLVPFLKQCEHHTGGAYNTLLRDYLVTMAKTDLVRPLKIIENSKTHLPNPVITKQAELMSLAIDAIYSCDRDDQLDLCLEVLKCLPVRGLGADTKEIQKLHVSVDKLEHQLRAAKVLEEYGIKKPVHYIKDTENKPDEVEQLFIKLTRTMSRREGSVSEAQWSKLHGDIMEMQDKVYRCISPALCHEIFVESLLCSSNSAHILLAGRLVERSVEESHRPTPQVYTMQTRVAYPRATELVLAAAHEYFNSSANLSDMCIGLARSCLNLIQDSPESIQEENDLISSLAVLDEFGLNILPLQVRLCSDRLELVKQVLATSATAYKQQQKLLRLGHLLRVAGFDRKDRDSHVLHLIARAALKVEDFSCAYEVCDSLMTEGHGPAWDVCVDLAEHEGFKNVKAKVDLLSFAVTFCCPDMIEPILQAKALLETEVLYEKINAKAEVSQEDPQKRISPFSTAALQFTANCSDPALDKRDDQGGFLNGDRCQVVAGNHQPHQTAQILTSTKQTTKAVLSTVTDAKWWQGTISRMKQPIRRQHSHDLTDRNKKIEKQACHPFYEDCIDGCYCNEDECDLRYMESHVDPGLLLSEELLRTGQLEEMLTEGEKSHPNTDVLLQLASENFCTDSTLSLAYLLALKQPVDADQCFKDHPRTDITLQLALYYYVLQLYTTMRPSDQTELSILYMQSPVRLMQKVTGLISNRKEVAWPECVTHLVEKIQHYNEMLADYRQAKMLIRLGRGIDTTRFAEDPEYKEETILGLAMTLDDEIYSMSLSLAERNNIPVWDVYATHLEFLFSDSGLSVEELTARVTKLDLLTTLRSKPAELCARLTKYVYPSLAGTDHKSLAYYYTVMSGCGQPLEAGLTADGHVKLLKKLKSVAPELDYKALMDEKTSVIDVLSPCLTATNITTIAKLAKQIPDGKSGTLDGSVVYCTWAVKYFWEADGKKEPANATGWLHRYESCGEYIQKLQPAYALKFLEAIVFSDKSRSLLEVGCRQEICKRMLKYGRQQAGGAKKKKSEEKSEMMWDAVIEKVGVFVQHLESLGNPVITAMAQSEVERIQVYHEMYDLSMGAPEQIHEFFMRVTLEGELPFETVQELLSAVAMETLSVRTVVRDSLDYLLQRMRSGGAEEDGRFEMETLVALQKVVANVQEYIEDGGDELTDEDVMSQLRPFCSDVTVEVQPRLDTLYILEKSFKLTEEDSKLLTLYRTQAVVAAIWSEFQIGEENILSNETRRKLFFDLLERSPAEKGANSRNKEFSALCKLLHLWPKFPKAKSDSDSPWVSVFKAMIGSGCPDNISAVIATVKSTEDSIPSLQSTKLLFSAMVDQKFAQEAVKFCLLTCHQELFSAAMETLAECSQIPDTEEELILLMLKNKLVPKLVHTRHYPIIIQHVLANQEPESESCDHLDVEKLAEQLRDGGFDAEAGSLLLQARSVPPMLQTFGSAMGATHKWFK